MFWESSVENGTYVNSSIILIPGWLCRQRRIWCRGTFIYYIEGDYRKYTKYNNVHLMCLSCNVRKFPNFTEKCRNIQDSNHFQEYPLSRPLCWSIARWTLSNNQSINITHLHLCCCHFLTITLHDAGSGKVLLISMTKVTQKFIWHPKFWKSQDCWIKDNIMVLENICFTIELYMKFYNFYALCILNPQWFCSNHWSSFRSDITISF